MGRDVERASLDTGVAGQSFLTRGVMEGDVAVSCSGQVVTCGWYFQISHRQQITGRRYLADASPANHEPPECHSCPTLRHNDACASVRSAGYGHHT